MFCRPKTAVSARSRAQRVGSSINDWPHDGMMETAVEAPGEAPNSRGAQQRDERTVAGGHELGSKFQNPPAPRIRLDDLDTLAPTAAARDRTPRSRRAPLEMSMLPSLRSGV